MPESFLISNVNGSINVIIIFKPYFKALIAWSCWGINSPTWGVGRHVLGP